MPRWPSTPTSSSSTAAPARPRATGRASTRWSAPSPRSRTTRRCSSSRASRSASSAPTSGRPACCWRTPTSSGDWATWPEFRRLENLGLTMYGQMTAGSWIYIGTQGILQGTYETFAAVAAKRFGGTLAGTLTVTAGCGGMGGAQPLAVTMNEGTCLMIDVDPTRLRRRVETRYLDEIADDLDDAIARVTAYTASAKASLRRPRRQRRHGPARAPAARRAGRHRHRPDVGARSAVLHPRGHRRSTTPASTRTGSPRSSPSGHRPRWPGMSRRWSASWTAAPRSSTTATRSATRRARAATTGPSPSPASSPPTSGRCSARARARSAGSH